MLSPHPGERRATGTAIRLARRYGFDLYLVGCNYLLSLPLHRLRFAVLTRLLGDEVSGNVALERHIKVTARGGVTISAGCQINRGVTLDGRGGIRIGSAVNISSEVMLLTADHDPSSATFEGRSRPIVIGNRAWIATRAIVLPGTTIGEGAVVAAGAVVHGEVPPWSIVAGNPAAVIGQRPSNAQQTAGPPYRRLLH